MRRDLGDFQTPPELVAEVLEALGPIGGRWPRVLEPTCGRGHFLAGILASPCPPREIQAIEIQESHHQAACAVLAAGATANVHVQITRCDVFGIDVGRDLCWRERGPLLVIGNPPWVTNSELGSLASIHRAPRHNLKGLRGLEARTGSSNFDVTEAIWIKLALELLEERPTIVFLCKTSVARGILQFAHGYELPIVSASIRRIDAARWFRAAVDACLFCVTLDAHVGVRNGAKRSSGKVAAAQPLASLQREGFAPARPTLSIPVYSSLSAPRPDTVMSFARGSLVADSACHALWSFADGVCPMHWRQGLKHDAAAVMELVHDRASGDWRNRGGDVVDVEADFVYPLMKGTDLTRASGTRPERATLLTQKSLGEPTEPLAERAPRLWSYLTSHGAVFSQRKSSIYRGRSPFSLFGIGPYSFARYKVAISGMHKTPRFRALGPVLERPVMLDDTCYFLACRTAEEASILTALCNDPISLGLMTALMFVDAKRPITKKLLQRIDFSAVLRRTDRRDLLARANEVLSDDLTAHACEPLAEVARRLEQGLNLGPRDVAVGVT